MCNMRSAKEAVIGDTYHLKVRHSLRAGCQKHQKSSNGVKCFFAHLVMGALHMFSHLKEAPSQAEQNTILRHFEFSGVALTDLGDLAQMH
jgi:hypothetical protein